jgi:hypothetical protein
MIKVSSQADTSGVDRMDRALVDLGQQAHKAGRAVTELDQQLRGLKDQHVRVKVDVDKPGPVGGGLDDKTVRIKVKVDEDTSHGSFKKFFGAVSGAAASAGGVAGKVFGNEFGLALVAVTVPVVVSGLASALSGALGAGVIGVGIAAAVAGDEGIRKAGSAAGKNFMSAMTDEAKTLAGPVRESLFVLEQAGGRIAAKWGQAFQDVQGSVVPLVRDLVVGFERISDSITGAVSNNGPAIAAFGTAWKLIADGVGDFLDEVSDGGDDAANTIVSIAAVIGEAARSVGQLTSAAEDLNKFNPAAKALDAYADHAKDAAGEVGTLAHRTKGVASAADEAAHAVMEETTAFEGLAKELKAQADPVFAIIKAQDDLADAQKETAKATKEHGKNSREAEDALQKQALAALSLESNVGKLGDTFNGKLSPAMRETLHTAGMSDKAIDRLEKQFREAKRAGDAFSKNYRARTTLDGYRNAHGQLTGLLRDLQNFDGTWTANMVTNYIRHGKPGTGGGLATGGIKGAANGATSNGLTWVGEHGPELMDVAPGTRVHSNPDSMRIAGDAGGGQSGPITVNLVVDGRVLAQAVVEPTRAMVARQASGSAQKFFGDPRLVTA